MAIYIMLDSKKIKEWDCTTPLRLHCLVWLNTWLNRGTCSPRFSSVLYLATMLYRVRLLARLQLQWDNLVYVLPASPVDPYPGCHINFSLQTKPWRPDVLLNVHKISNGDTAVWILPAQNSITGAKNRNIANKNSISEYYYITIF